MKNGRVEIVHYLMEINGFNFIHRFFQVLFRKEHFISSDIAVKIIIHSCQLNYNAGVPLRQNSITIIPDFDVV